MCKLTKKSKTANGKLTYPIAQMTADEIAFAGGVESKSAPAWYYYNSVGENVVKGNWWTMSPFRSDSSLASVFYVIGSAPSGCLSSNTVWGKNSVAGIRPVLSLKSCVSYESGNGSSSNPYTVSIDSTCATAIN